MANVGAPAIIEPAGPRSPAALLRFKFGPATDQITSYDVQVTQDRTYDQITDWDGAQRTAGIAGRRVDAPYAGTALAAGRLYWWRARGRIGGLIGPWSRSVRFDVDPAAVRAPYDAWAAAVLAAMAYPRPLSLLGTLLPVGAEVRALLPAPYLSRARVLNVTHPPTIDRTVEMAGVSLHLSYEGGWEVQLVTHDLAAEG